MGFRSRSTVSGMALNFNSRLLLKGESLGIDGHDRFNDVRTEPICAGETTDQIFQNASDDDFELKI